MAEVNNKMSYSSLGLPPKHGNIPAGAHLYNRNPNSTMVGTTMMGLQLGDPSIGPLPSIDEYLPSLSIATKMNRMNSNINIGINGTATNVASEGRFNFFDPKTSVTASDCGLKIVLDHQNGIGSTGVGEISNTINTSTGNNLMDVMGAGWRNNKPLPQPPLPFDHHHGISPTTTLLLPSSSSSSSVLATVTPKMSLFEKISKATTMSSSSSMANGISSTGDGGLAVGGIAARVLSNTSVKSKPKKRGHPQCRPIDPHMDPKKAKRVIANRLSAQKSRLRKLAYLAELEKTVEALEARVDSIAPKVAEHDRQRLLIRMENNSMKQKIGALISEQAFKDAQFQALKEERDKLVQLYMLQQQQNQKQHEQHQMQKKQQEQLWMTDIFEPLQQPANLVIPMNGNENGNGININSGDIGEINTNSINNDHVGCFM